MLKYLSLPFILLAAAFANAQPAELPDEKLHALAEASRADAVRALGYPGNQRVALKDFYKWYTESGLCNLLLNNAGDPFKASGALNSLAFEREVIEFFAPFYGIAPEKVWGMVTMSGTDGNNHGIYFGYKLLQRQTNRTPILYVSKESHYSNKRLADLQNIETRLIDCDAMGRMLPDALRQALDPSRPALVVYSVGTTFKGAIDDQDTLNAVLDEVRPVAVYRHADAALFGGYLPFTEHKAIVDTRLHKLDSIAVSGHKFFGMDSPCGIFLTTKEVLAKQTPFEIAYLNGSMPMINCSRSAVNPLKFYWIVKQIGPDGFREQANQLLQNASYLKARLDAIGWQSWKGEFSNTVFFKRPSDALMKKYNLAPEHDPRFGGDLAHVVVMQQADKTVLDAFVADLQKELKQ